MKRMRDYDPRKIILNAYMHKHKSCGGCQQRWKNMKQRFNWNAPPKALQQKAKHSGDLNDLMNMFWEKQNG